MTGTARSRLALALVSALGAASTRAAPHLEALKLPPGYSVALFSDAVPNARALALGANGTVFVGSSGSGKVYALTDADHDGRAEKVRVVASGLKLPAGVAFHDGALYIGAVDRVLRLDAIEQHLDAPPAPVVVTDALPKETAHGLRHIAFGPDGKLYVPIGAPCNVCDKAGYGKIVRMNADGSGAEDVATGVRNSVGLAWRAGDASLWFTDNGRDNLGDDLPSDELDRATKPDENFGFPFCHQGDTLDAEFGKGKKCADYTPPVHKLGAHVASLGLRFYEGKAFPPADRGALFVAEHGSWNRSVKSGYRVVRLRLDGQRVASDEPFLTGFLVEDQPWGRPVDVQPMPDGSLLVSDDLAGAVYRVTYAAPK